MQNSQWTLNGQCTYKSLNGQLSRDKGLYCLTMEIVYWTTFNVSTLNGQWTSIVHPLIASTLNGQLDILYLGRKGDKKIQWKCGHLPNLPLQPTPKSSLVYFRLKKAFFPLQIEPLMFGRSQLPSVKHVLGVLEWSCVVPKKCFLYQLLWFEVI